MRTPLKIIISALVALLLIFGTFFGSTLLYDNSRSIGRLTDNPLEVSRPAEILEVSDVPYEAPLLIEYPYGWLVTDEIELGVSQGQAVRILYLPEIEILPRIEGTVSETEDKFVPSDPELAYIALDNEEENEIRSIDPTHLLVNLPDIIPDAIYDIRYAYDTPSRSGGHEIEGLTGVVLPGYISELQYDSYLCEENRPAPAAYGLAVKLSRAQSALFQQRYRLVVWDCYRPYQASRYISDKFADAYMSTLEIQKAVGAKWGLSWYAADGVSGHNYGSDIDVSVADAEGNVLAMPSDFDAFDDTAHLVDYPMNSSSISPSSYREEVADNAACSALHEAMTKVGLSELASEWWHFADKASESDVSSLVGERGMDFTASFSS